MVVLSFTGPVSHVSISASKSRSWSMIKSLTASALLQTDHGLRTHIIMKAFVTRRLCLPAMSKLWCDKVPRGTPTVHKVKYQCPCSVRAIAGRDVHLRVAH